MIIAGMLVRIVKVFLIMKVSRLPGPVGADRPVLVIVKDVSNER